MEGATNMINTVYDAQTLFRAGDEGYACYRIPALVVSKKGTILAFAEGRKDSKSDYADIDMALKRSFDGGRTWTDVKFIVDDGDHSMGNPCAVVERDTGTIILVFCRESRQILVTKSGNDGESWSEPEDISGQTIESCFYFVYTGPGHGIQLSSGRLLIPSSGDYGKRIGGEQGSYILYSDDRGKTWQVGGYIDKDLTDECEVVELADGTVYLNGRSRQGKKQRGYSYSKDGGRSWSPIQFDPGMPESSCQGSVIRFTGEKEDDRNRILQVCPANPYGRAQLTARLSYDETKSWPEVKVIYDGAAAYSDLAVSREKDVLCAYEADDYTKIVLARFNVDWLTDGKDSLR